MSEDEILNLIQTQKLSDENIYEFIKTGKKDVLISLCKFQVLSHEHIDAILDNSPYLAIKFIIKNQNLNSQNRENILRKINKLPQIYKEIIDQAKELKW